MTPEERIKAKNKLLDSLASKPIKITPVTRRMIVIVLGIGMISLIIGAAAGHLTINDIKAPLASIITGFFTLLTGDR